MHNPFPAPATDLNGREIVYKGADLAETVLAYAITVHKSQGSECKCLILPIHTCQLQAI